VGVTRGRRSRMENIFIATSCCAYLELHAHVAREHPQRAPLQRGVRVEDGRPYFQVHLLGGSQRRELRRRHHRRVNYKWAGDSSRKFHSNIPLRASRAFAQALYATRATAGGGGRWVEVPGGSQAPACPTTLDARGRKESWSGRESQARHRQQADNDSTLRIM